MPCAHKACVFPVVAHGLCGFHLRDLAEHHREPQRTAAQIIRQESNEKRAKHAERRKPKWRQELEEQAGTCTNTTSPRT